MAVALAGPTPRPPADPIDLLPADVINRHNVPCVSEAMEAYSPTTTTEDLNPSARPMCTHLAVVGSDRETANQLADRLARYYEGRGFVFEGTKAGESRSYHGEHPVCRTIFTIDSGQSALVTASSIGAGIDPTALPPGAGQALGPAASLPQGALDPTLPLPAIPGGGVGGVTPSEPTDPATAGVGDLPGGTVVLTVQQRRAVTPRNAAGRC